MDLRIGGMATYNNVHRLTTLPRVLASIVLQLDVLHLYWNGPGLCPSWIVTLFPTVQVHTGPDIADMGKFWILTQDPPEGMFFALDDDVVYPEGYVFHLCAEIMAYHRRPIVGYRGVRIHGWPVDKSYYHERIVWHQNEAQDEDVAVHLVTTNLAAWHTSAIDVTQGGLPLETGMYMADLWLGRLAQEQQVPTVCLAHPGQWLTMLRHPTSICATYTRNDGMQAAYVNEKPWVVLPLPDRMHEEE